MRLKDVDNKIYMITQLPAGHKLVLSKWMKPGDRTYWDGGWTRPLTAQDLANMSNKIKRHRYNVARPSLINHNHS